MTNSEMRHPGRTHKEFLYTHNTTHNLSLSVLCPAEKTVFQPKEGNEQSSAFQGRDLTNKGDMMHCEMYQSSSEYVFVYI